MPTHSKECLVPPEVVETIIDFVSLDLFTLKSLALVSKSTCYRSQTHLLSSISLSSPGTCQSFYELLEESPHIAYFVKHLRVTDPSWRGPKPSWITSDTNLPLILDTLVYVESLSFEFPSRTWWLTWSGFSPALKASLARFSKPDQHQERAALRTLSVSNIDSFPCLCELIRFISSCATLKRLSLHRVYGVPPLGFDWPGDVVIGNDTTNDTVPLGPQLDSLSISEWRSVPIDALLMNRLPISVRRLRKFVCVHGESRGSLLQRFWSSVGDTLEDMTIVDYSARTSLSPIATLLTTNSLPLLTSLKRLTLRFSIIPTSNSGEWFDYDLSSVYDLPALQELLVIFEIGYTTFDIRNLPKAEDTPCQWRSLDALLSKPLPQDWCSTALGKDNNRRVEFRVPGVGFSREKKESRYADAEARVHAGDGDGDGEDGWQPLRVFVEECFPVLSSRGCLRFGCE